MGTSIDPSDPWEDPGCAHCKGVGELFEEGSPNQLRVKYTLVENCPLFSNAPAGDFVIPWVGAGQPCNFELWDGTGRYHFIAAMAGGVQCWCDMHELDHTRYYFDNFNTDKTGYIANKTVCNLFGPPLHSGKNGHVNITPGYASDPLFFAWGLGMMPRSPLKYDDFEIDGSDEKVLLYGNLPDSINIRIRYQPANT